MRVTGYRLAMLRVPLREVFTTALRRVDQVEDLVLVLETDCGRTGYGSAPATRAITGEDHASIIAALEHDLLPPVVGAGVDALPALLASLPGGNSNARAALEVALFDLAAQDRGLPLCQLLGGAPGTLHTSLTISVNAPAAMAASARAALERGFTCLKLKLGGEPAEDLQRVRHVAVAVAGAASLYLDANQACNLEQACWLLAQLAGEGIAVELLEQPLPAGDLDGMARLRQRVKTPVMADESVFDPEDAARVIAAGAADILNIKLVKSGGVSGALAIADQAAAAGLSCMMGCMLESAIGVAAAAHVAAARPEVITRVDLDAPLLARGDPVRGGTRFSAAAISLNRTPGLGIAAIDGLDYL
ncbi:dipeptide epimerase [Seongchinamella sediminis]|uniref:Dipeptide epimerase n=1 Tax=Seongchinamella sediminis TaxID=2283635 RepID=A0A3L7E4E1_9GAMM|nr:dipeptide epimerase [Seongchinamella sediminis]RLQ23302.1 dipeptide epimerase [Seongchinamella sediminis]